MWPTHFIPIIYKKGRIEGIAPPSFYLTTPPYPMEVIEALLSGMDIADGKYLVGLMLEKITSSNVPLSGILRVLLIQVDVEIERITSTLVPVSGILRVLLISIVQGHDSLSVTAVPISGVLLDKLIRYQYWPLRVDLEDITSSNVPLSGVLT